MLRVQERACEVKLDRLGQCGKEERKIADKTG